MTKGEKIKFIRSRLGKTQTAFADQIGVSKQTLWKYEEDIITNIPSDKIEAIADAANIDPGWIMGWKDAVYNPDDIHPLLLGDPDEIRLVKSFRAADPCVQMAVRKLLDLA